MDMELKNYINDGVFDMSAYMTAMNAEYQRRKNNEIKKKTEEITEVESLAEISANWREITAGHNFIIEASREKALAMNHIKIIYAKKEQVYFVVFEEDLNEVLMRKIMEVKARMSKNV